MERNITHCLNKLPAAAASRQHGPEVHSDFTGAVYLDMQLFIRSAARNIAQRPGCPGAATVLVTIWGRDGVCHCLGQGRCLSVSGAGTAALAMQKSFAPSSPSQELGGCGSSSGQGSPTSPGCSVTASG